MFNKFKEWGFVTDSPYSGIINVNFSRESNIRVLTETEVKSILKKARSYYPKLYYLILLVISTGLKKAEIQALKKEDIDIKNRKISINKTLVDNELLIPRSKTTIRQVDISENIVPELKKAVKSKQENDFIFYDKTKSSHTQNKQIRKHFKTLLNQLNIERLTFDELRHTYAYNALQRGISIDYLHKQLGDYSIQATMDRYRNFIP